MPKVCILAAGIGSRNKCIEGLHKALLPLNNKPVISHIIDSFPQDVEIVIAFGCIGCIVKKTKTCVSCEVSNVGP